jgi:hypothetical protein
MRQSHLGVSCAAAVILLAAGAAPVAQVLPPFDQFDGALQACAAGENITLTADLSASIRQVYDGQGESSFADSATFLSRIPEKERFEAYRLYVECITKILGKTAVKPLPTTVTYRVCSGEYEKSCQKHNAYLYCGDDIAAWARRRCTSSTVQRLSTYGGNKCGYSLDAVICAGPKAESKASQGNAPKLRRTGHKSRSARHRLRGTGPKLCTASERNAPKLRGTGHKSRSAHPGLRGTGPKFVSKCKRLIHARRGWR